VQESRLGDFTTDRRVLLLSGASVVVGGVVAGVALGLLDLIALITHLVYTGQASTKLERPDIDVLGGFSVLIPVAGGLVVGAMAKFGSERIRGHGIPEAMETILLGGSRMQPRVAVLKPLSSAISIGTGGPFGAEGPIIVTGGAVGSITGQMLHLSAAERRALLVAGAAGGMTAVFGTPVAAVLLAVELLLFEIRPRSFVPAAFAAGTAMVVRTVFVNHHLLSAAPLFRTPAHPPVPLSVVGGAIVIGIAGAALSWLLTKAVYLAEDTFLRLPIHRAWWPAIGGVVVGVGGLIEPKVLGVGYDVIDSTLAGKFALGTLFAVAIGKLIVWAVALGSNTSGGILAPLLMIGAAVGGILGHVLPGAGPGTYALLGMAAALAGVTRSPLTSVVFALELTWDIDLLLPLLLACSLAHLFSVLVLRRSILTEKVARRGYHVSREYSVDPLQALFVRDVMTPDVLTVQPNLSVAEFYAALPPGSADRRQRLYPLLEDGRLAGVLPWSRVLVSREENTPAADLVVPVDASVRGDDTLREAANLMVATGHGVLPVVSPDGELLGLITQFDLLRAHERTLVEERHRESPLRPRWSWWYGTAAAVDRDDAVPERAGVT
jgi:H+/Cl- antiporter ClcA